MNWKLDSIAFEDYGVSVSKATGVLDLPKIVIPKHNWLDEDGLEFSATVADYKNKERSIRLSCYIVAGDIDDLDTQVAAFWAAISATGLRELSCDYITTPIECFLKTKVIAKRITGYADDKQVATFIINLTVAGDGDYDLVNIVRTTSLNVIATVQCKDLQIQKSLQGKMSLTMSFESNDVIDIRYGDFIQLLYDGNGFDRFILETEPSFTKKSTNKYLYTLKFNHQFNYLAVTAFLFGGEGDFYLYADFETVVDLIITNNTRTFSKFVKGTVVSTEKRNHKFSDENCLEVLRRMAKEYELEYEFVHQIPAYKYLINVAEEVANTIGVTLEYGSGNGQYELQRSERIEDEFCTRLFAFGADKNLRPDYRSGLKRLSFANNPLENNIASYGLKEKIVFFDEEFPQRTSTVTAYYQVLPDDLTDKQKQSYANGIYRIEDTTLYNATPSLDFDLNDYLLEGVPAKIRMKSGNLAGYEFEIWKYDHANQFIYIITQKNERGEQFPNTDSQIAIGDDYTLVDIDQPASYISTAETALEAAATAYLTAQSTPQFTYKCTVDPVHVIDNDLYFEVGDRVTLIDSDYGINGLFRISALRYKGYTGEYELMFSPKAVEGSIHDLDTRVKSTERAIGDTKQNTVEKSSKSAETTGELKNRILEPNDDLLGADRVVRNESIDPRMMSYDSGMPQISIKNALVEVNVAGDEDDIIISAGHLVMHNFADNTTNRWAIQEIKDAAGDYDPTRTWVISETPFTLATSNGYWIYAKLTMSTGSTVCVIEVFEDHKEIKLDIATGYLKYKLGYISAPVSGVRYGSMLWGNLKQPLQVNSDWDAVTGIAEILNKPTAYILPLATSTIRGGIKIGYSPSANDFALVLTSEKAHVIIPTATDLVRGIATFHADYFVVSSGAVAIKTGGIIFSNLNDDVISGQTALTAGLASTDELMVSDGGVLKKMDVSVLITGLTALTTGLVSTDELMVNDNGTLKRMDISVLKALFDTYYNDYSLPAATSTVRGGIKIGFTSSGLNFAVLLSAEKAYVTLVYATDTLKGIASFATANFLVTGGAVEIKTGGVVAANLNTALISGLTALTTGLLSTDELMVSDGGTLKRMDISVLKAYMQAGLTFSAVHDAVTIGTANGLSLSTQQLSLAAAGASTTGALTSTDWNTFNEKADNVNENLDEITGDFIPASTTGVVNIKVSSNMYVHAKVEVFIRREYGHINFASKAVYATILFAASTKYTEQIDTIYSAGYAGPTINVDLAQTGSNGYIRAVFTGLTTGVRYDYKIVVNYIYNGTYT